MSSLSKWELITGSYITTKHEKSTFSLFQSRFEDGVKQNTEAISLASTRSHISRSIKIGVSVGVIAFFLLSLIAAIFFVKKKKGASIMAENGIMKPWNLPSHDSIESRKLPPIA